jgi:hypothetical protein
MKSVVLIIICFLGLTCLSFVPKNDENIPSSQPQVKIALDENSKEDFFDFLWTFCTDEQFQLSRINFPLEFIHYNDDYSELDTTYLKKEEWNFQELCFKEPNFRVYGQVYDNFEHALRDTDMRVYASYGIGNGVKDYLYFKCINGKWFLIKREDRST